MVEIKSVQADAPRIVRFTRGPVGRSVSATVSIGEPEHQEELMQNTRGWWQ